MDKERAVIIRKTLEQRKDNKISIKLEVFLYRYKVIIMSHSSTYDPFVLNKIPTLTRQSILDCGCGLGIWGYMMRANKNGDQAYMVGVDRTVEYLEFDKKHRVYDDLVKADVVFLPFKVGSFDLVLASEVIEHISKVKGTKFLSELERVCKNKLIVTTPQGFAPRTVPVSLEAEKHRSGWTSADFKKRGYAVHGIGFRFFKLWLGTRFLSVYGALFSFFTPFSWLMPSLAEYLIAQKHLARSAHAT